MPNTISHPGSDHRTWSDFWLSVPIVGRVALAGAISAIVGLAFLKYLTSTWDFKGALSGFAIGFIVELLVECSLKLFQYSNSIKQSLVSLENLVMQTEKKTNDLASMAMIADIGKLMFNDSPFTGVLGTLFSDSKGKPFIDGDTATSEKYLERLGDAIKATEDKFYTIQPLGYDTQSHGIEWFNGKDRSAYLRHFREKKRLKVVRVFVMPNTDEITNQQTNSTLVGNYLKLVGDNTESFWISIENLERIEQEMKSNPRYQEKNGEIYGQVKELETSDSVVCEGKLFFKFNMNAIGPDRKIYFDHNHRDDKYPFRWVFENISDLRGFVKVSSQNIVSCKSKLENRFKEISIDLQVVRSNLELISAQIPLSKLMAVLKSDAYGLGIDKVCSCFERTGIEWFGVSSIDEALVLRKTFTSANILVMEAMHWTDCIAIVDENIHCFLWSLKHAYELDTAAKRRSIVANVHIKVNTGMNRLGVASGSLQDFLQQMKQYSNVKIVGIGSHLLAAEHLQEQISQEQIRLFSAAIQITETHCKTKIISHLGNSISLINGLKPSDVGSSNGFNLARVGGALFGMITEDYPSDHPYANLRECVSVTGRIVHVLDVPAGEPISYCPVKVEISAFSQEGNRKIGVVNLGYLDGVPYCYGKGGKVLVNGKPCNVVGRICTGMTMIDITELDKATPVNSGDEVVFLGQSRVDSINSRKAVSYLKDKTLLHPYKLVGDFGRMLGQTHKTVIQ